MCPIFREIYEICVFVLQQVMLLRASVVSILSAEGCEDRSEAVASGGRRMRCRGPCLVVWREEDEEEKKAEQDEEGGLRRSHSSADAPWHRRELPGTSPDPQNHWIFRISNPILEATSHPQSANMKLCPTSFFAPCQLSEPVRGLFRQELATVQRNLNIILGKREREREMI